MKLFKRAKRTEIIEVKQEELLAMDLLPAKEAYKAMKPEQIRKAIEKVNQSIASGNTSCYITTDEKPCDEVIDLLLEKGYDVSIHVFSSMSNEMYPDYFVKAYFINKASGELHFENEESRQLWYEN